MSRRENSYAIDRFYDPQLEANRLEIREKARIETLVPQMKSIGLKPNMRILEVGPGTGLRSLVFSNFLSKGSFWGIDISDTLLERARKALKGQKNVHLLPMDVYDLQFEENFFDFIYIRLVIQHLPDPVKALRNLHQILKPGGKVFIEDTDRDWMCIYPIFPAWERLYGKVKQAQVKTGGDPNSGRKLGAFLSSAGFDEVGTNLVPVTGSDNVLADWLENYAPTFFNNLTQADRRVGFKLLEEIRKRHQKSQVFFHQVWFQAWGEK